MTAKTEATELARLKAELEAARANRLTCGGKGPCCHIAYSHRHCGHCDTVISTHQCFPWHSGAAAAPIWGNGVTIRNGADLRIAAGVPSQTFGAIATTAQSHTCEVKP